MSLKYTLAKHTKTITAVAISPDGKFLISGANDARAVVWNLQTGEMQQVINCAFHGPISAIKWIVTNMAFVHDPFVVGCADGSLQLYEKSTETSKFTLTSITDAHAGAVEDFDWEPRHQRLASCGHGSPQVWSLQGQRTFTALVQSPPRHPFIARTVKFVDDGSNLLVCYLESHQIECFSVEPWTLKWSKTIGTRIGYATVDGDHLFVSNLVNGIDTYKIPTMERVHSIPHTILTNRPLQLSVTAKGAWLVSGGDDGNARIYDGVSGRFIEHLHHGEPNTLVQVVDSYQDQHQCIIATASTSAAPFSVKLWVQHTRLAEETTNGSKSKSTMSWWLRAQIFGMVIISYVAINSLNIHWLWHVVLK
ncbi:WD40-repeat-containing domain protein [Hygrophoropsis aurantiaca]|uniref:WD40-repeat-containing domain protein n=1 Tax=Hygrophoropsis aurantiaca TaxID=72124 RepID=A0ACB8A017_9AGAM|nr:WD40-repeat-containing domain protein [Hygrophoropsis aurantiaca]